MASEKHHEGRVRALGLLSGGLDSTLAARLLQEQGIEVEGVHFSTGFCKTDHRRALRRESDHQRPERLRSHALHAGATLRAPVEIVDVAEEYFREVVVRPKHGYGSAMNPCIDCRIFMLRKAAEIAKERGAEVVFTGEVVGQRPMSQHRAALDTVERESGIDGGILRPLSAPYLAPTRAEREGKVDRERLGRAHGRGRKEQMRLARELGVAEFPAPSGGCCFLADRNFARRLRDLLSHRDPDRIRTEELQLLKVGRHFRFAHDLKAIFGRDEAESRFLKARAGASDGTCQVADGHGALGLVDGTPGPDRVERVAALAARYSAERERPLVEVVFRQHGEDARLRVIPAGDACLAALRI